MLIYILLEFFFKLVHCFVPGLCKPTKSTEDLNYEDDTPVENDNDEEEDDDDINTPNGPPQILSNPQSFRVFAGSTIILPCQVVNSGL